MKERDWEQALMKFLASWKRRKDVIGALVTGSRVFGTHNQHSDIDVHILLAKDITWRERGNCFVDGYLIEYFSNPLVQLKEYRKEDFKSFTHTDARMFALGRIIFDKTGTLKKLQQDSRRELRAKFRRLSKTEIELGKYSLWDELDNLKDLWERKSHFYTFSHNLLLQRILELYRKFLGLEVSSSSKLERYFTDKSFRQRYGIEHFHDSHFVKLFMVSIEKQTFSSISTLVEYVLKAMNGFEIDGWKLRSMISVAKQSRKTKK